MLTTLMTSAILPTVFSVSISSRQPTRNMNSDDADLSDGAQRRQRRGGNSMPDRFGATHPSSDGPSRSPAIISAMTGGWPRRAAIGVARRERTRMTAI